MEIATAAKKCPYCHHGQNKFSAIALHPGFAVLVTLVPMTIFLTLAGAMFRRTFDAGEDFRTHFDQVKVLDSEVRFGESEDGPTVAVVGRISNTSDVPWKDICFQVDFLDESDRLIDAVQEYKFQCVCPSHDEIGFKVSFPREFPEASYVQHKIRVVSAKDARSRF
jgi:hypothetical protein